MYADVYHTCEQKNEKVQRNRLINYNIQEWLLDKET